MPVFPGVGERMKERLRAIGYVKDNGELATASFAVNHGYVTSFVYDWLADRRTPIKELERLAKDLDTTPAWLCFGESGGAASSSAPQKKRAMASARRGTLALPERRTRTRRRRSSFPGPLPEMGRRPVRDNMLRSSSIYRVPRAA